MTTDAIYQKIRECIQYRIEQDRQIMQGWRGIAYVQAEARIEAYERVLDDLYASQANMEERNG